MSAEPSGGDPAKKRRAIVFAIALVIFVVDRFTKYLVETRLQGDDSRVVIPNFFNIVHSENQGIAFGIFQDGAFQSQTLVLVLLSVAVVGLLAFMLWRSPQTIGLTLIFGGALGNVYDRIRFGRVTDFLDFYAGTHHWYTFNLADASIVTGACLLVLQILF